MKAHAALPDGEYLQWVHQEIGGFVEQNLAETAAENDPEHAVEKQVIQLLDCEEARVTLYAGAAEQNKLNEGQQVHQTIPTHGKRAKRESHGVELGVKKH